MKVRAGRVPKCAKPGSSGVQPAPPHLALHRVLQALTGATVVVVGGAEGEHEEAEGVEVGLGMGAQGYIEVKI